MSKQCRPVTASPPVGMSRVWNIRGTKGAFGSPTGCRAGTSTDSAAMMTLGVLRW